MLNSADQEVVIKLGVDFVLESYATWKSTKVGKEPNLTCTIILDYVLQHGQCPTALRYSSRRQQQAMMRCALNKAKRRMLLGSSTGSGDYGQEARCYEPSSYLASS